MQLFNLLALAAAVSAVPSGTHKLHEKRDSISPEWIKGKEVPHHEILPVRIGMQQQNLDRGHDLLMEVSDPSSARYGQHYSPEEVADVFAPSANAVETIREWLHDSGIDRKRVSQSWNKQWMQFDANARELGQLLNTKFYEHLHEPTGKTHVACDE